LYNKANANLTQVIHAKWSSYRRSLFSHLDHFSVVRQSFAVGETFAIVSRNHNSLKYLSHTAGGNFLMNVCTRFSDTYFCIVCDFRRYKTAFVILHNYLQFDQMYWGIFKRAAHFDYRSFSYRIKLIFQASRGLV